MFEKHVIEFLEGLAHGPCAGVPLVEYEKWVRSGALRLLAELDGQEVEHAFERQERPEFPFGEFDNGGHWRGEG